LQCSAAQFILPLACKKEGKKERKVTTLINKLLRRDGGGGRRSYMLALQAHFSDASFKSRFMFIFLWQACFII